MKYQQRRLYFGPQFEHTVHSGRGLLQLITRVCSHKAERTNLGAQLVFSCLLGPEP